MAQATTVASKPRFMETHPRLGKILRKVGRIFVDYLPDSPLDQVAEKRGFNVSLFGNYIRGNQIGLNASIGGNSVYDSQEGVNIGLMNVVGRTQSGVSLSLFNLVNGRKQKGVVISAINAGDYCDLSSTGFFVTMGNLVDLMRGVAIAILTNRVDQSFKGVLIGGLVNVIGNSKESRGVSIAPLTICLDQEKWYKKCRIGIAICGISMRKTPKLEQGPADA